MGGVGGRDQARGLPGGAGRIPGGRAAQRQAGVERGGGAEEGERGPARRRPGPAPRGGEREQGAGQHQQPGGQVGGAEEPAQRLVGGREFADVRPDGVDTGGDRQLQHPRGVGDGPREEQHGGRPAADGGGVGVGHGRPGDRIGWTRPVQRSAGPPLSVGRPNIGEWPTAMR